MIVSGKDVLDFALKLSQISKESSIDELENTGLHREVEKLSIEWFEDFVIGMILGLMI